VEQLRDLPTPLPQYGNGPRPVGELLPIPQSELIRDTSYRELHRLGPAGISALARAYRDADVRLRRNVALAFLVLAEGIWPGLPKLDVGSALPELTIALTDDDPDVRAWSAHAIGAIGPGARPAVPALIRLLRNRDEGSRNSACIGLTGIGPSARSALPALRRALSDRSDDVRKFARRAILAIEG
jgi:HEAT repeat protein